MATNKELVEKEINIFKYTIHYARIHNYNDNTYKWRHVIPIKKVYNYWVVIPLFTEKSRFKNMNNYLIINELSKNINVYIYLSRQDKILLNKNNFEYYPIKFENGKWYKVKKSTIKIIQEKQNIYLYEQMAICITNKTKTP